MRFKWIITGALLLCLSVQAWAADGPYYIDRTEVNLRAQPNGEIVLVLDLNEKVFVIERDGDWNYISAPVIGLKGWVWRAYCGDNRVAVPDVAVLVEPIASQAASDAPVQGLVTDIVIEEGETLTPGIATIPAEPPVMAQATPNQLITTPAPPTASSVAMEQPQVISSGFIPDTPAPAAVQIQLDTPAGDATPVAFYQPFERDLDITIPAVFGSSYQPVGGNDIALITGMNVNVRSEHSTGSRILGNVSEGEKAYVMSEQESWYLLSIPSRDIKGWVHSDYVNQLPRVEIIGNDVRLREKPSLSARIKTELNDGDVFQKFENSNGWVLLASSASGLKGWVHADFVKKTERAASRPYTVTGDSVNFRTSPAVDAEVITSVDSGVKVEVLGRNDRWSFAEYNGQQGWMYSQYLDPDFKNAPQKVYGKSIGGRLITRAREMTGVPYVWGGESDSGVDCSGLIYKLLLDEGADASGLPRRASTQMAQLGLTVDKEDLAPGDLVFFTTYKAGASHVGIYLGDGDFIHASSAQSKVTISNMSDGYYKKRFVGARRITESELTNLK